MPLTHVSGCDGSYRVVMGRFHIAARLRLLFYDKHSFECYQGPIGDVLANHNLIYNVSLDEVFQAPT